MVNPAVASVPGSDQHIVGSNVTGPDAENPGGKAGTPVCKPLADFVNHLLNCKVLHYGTT
jgi:hypothetical protein